MIVKTHIASLWHTPSRDGLRRITDLIDEAPDDTALFFRADDVAVPGGNCRQMMDLFIAHGIPLHMAVTPAWLTQTRWEILNGWAGDSNLFCWHQHGWQHRSHQTSGKKSEFGDHRPAQDKTADLLKGKERLTHIMGPAFSPAFTPPWNRFDAQTGTALAELGYTCVSRSAGEQRKVPLPDSLPDIPINVDLHTRNEADPKQGWTALATEFQTAIQSGRIGIMLHHQRMNPAAMAFLDTCLHHIKSNPKIQCIRFNTA
ncbi:polysaccharide deacetylase family protein [Pseudodesulfovibrio sp. JC047]|uniref:polysaccharide deacetylase family protein n=1 Tax=Pseudodesulfovibrio sp. JC047 TaxID=2683199 RepID=UPI0013D70D37|nr:polysaccharide deacetylase family protein [Pseudodesulfovibrio sp. JC047]NDV20073.1 polysaccharide deacetylase family protein [Pseudodesulfovibrio sp. JC047]